MCVGGREVLEAGAGDSIEAQGYREVFADGGEAPFHTEELSELSNYWAAGGVLPSDEWGGDGLEGDAGCVYTPED